jgi:diaminopropionate ammonia-lyase
MSGFRLVRNARAVRTGDYPFAHWISVHGARQALAEMARCPHYRPTPLLDLGGIARRAGVHRVFYKNESPRFGIGSFKALGGAYAVALLLAEHAARHLGRQVSIAELASGSLRDVTRDITVVCASDGNHGRAVAAGAQVFGCHCVIFLHEGVSIGRERAITALGATAVRTQGNYDDSVRAAASAALACGWQVVSDTSWPGYEAIPARIMQGYTVMALEVLQQLQAMREEPPTHVFLQGGVGGLAAAIVAHFREELGAARAPTFVIVEPERADCLFQSALAGDLRASRGDLDTIMAGLACGEPSPIAWSILAAGADFFMTIPDDAAVAAMRLLAMPEDGSSPVIAGESATAGLAALLALASGEQHRPEADPQLNAHSRVLLFGTEGATDPELYRELVGRDACPSAALEATA